MATIWILNSPNYNPDDIETLKEFPRDCIKLEKSVVSCIATLCVMTNCGNVGCWVVEPLVKFGQELL